MVSNNQAFDIAMQKAIAFYLREHSDKPISKQALSLYTAIVTQYILELGTRCKRAGELGSRSLPNLNDVQHCLDDMGHSVGEMSKFAIKSKNDDFSIQLIKRSNELEQTGDRQKDIFSGYNQEVTLQVLKSAKGLVRSPVGNSGSAVEGFWPAELPPFIPEFFPKLPSSHTYKSTMLKPEDELKNLLSGNFPNAASLFGGSSSKGETVLSSGISGSLRNNKVEDVTASSSAADTALRDSISTADPVNNASASASISISTNSNSNLEDAKSDTISQGPNSTAANTNASVSKLTSVSESASELALAAGSSSAAAAATAVATQAPSREEAELNILKLRAHQKYLVQSSLENLFNKTLFPNKALDTPRYFEMMGQFANGNEEQLDNGKNKEKGRGKDNCKAKSEQILGGDSLGLKRKQSLEPEPRQGQGLDLNLELADRGETSKLWARPLNKENEIDTITDTDTDTDTDMDTSRDTSKDTEMGNGNGLGQDQHQDQNEGKGKDKDTHLQNGHSVSTFDIKNSESKALDQDLNRNQENSNKLENCAITLETLESMFPPANYYNTKRYKAH